MLHSSHCSGLFVESPSKPYLSIYEFRRPIYESEPDLQQVSKLMSAGFRDEKTRVAADSFNLRLEDDSYPVDFVQEIPCSSGEGQKRKEKERHRPITTSNQEGETSINGFHCIGVKALLELGIKPTAMSTLELMQGPHLSILGKGIVLLGCFFEPHGFVTIEIRFSPLHRVSIYKRVCNLSVKRFGYNMKTTTNSPSKSTNYCWPIWKLPQI